MLGAATVRVIGKTRRSETNDILMSKNLIGLVSTLSAIPWTPACLTPMMCLLACRSYVSRLQLILIVQIPIVLPRST